MQHTTSLHYRDHSDVDVALRTGQTLATQYNKNINTQELTARLLTGSGILGGVRARPGGPSLRGGWQGYIRHLPHRFHICADQKGGLFPECKGCCGSWL